MSENEEAKEAQYNVERMELLHKGKLFHLVFVPIIGKSKEELAHWLNQFNEPKFMQAFIEELVEKMDKKRIAELQAGGQ